MNNDPDAKSRAPDSPARSRNLAAETVAGFGDEWSRFDQTSMADAETRQLFDSYFHIFPWAILPPEATGFDLGCGSGRWAKLVAERVGKLHCIDASPEALAVAQRNLRHLTNCVFHNASVDAIPLPDGSMDFGFSLGVLHHVPDTLAGIQSCVAKLKPGAPFLIYLYYALDNRSDWFRFMWRASDLFRRAISPLPHRIRFIASQAFAFLVYFPLARGALILEKLGMRVESFPLAFYRHRSFYVMRTDALDRLGTQLEHRFKREEILSMMERAGLENIRFSDAAPYWCAVGTRSRP